MRTIDQNEFEQLFPYKQELSPLIGEGVEWFADDASDIIGNIGRDISRKIWNYLILERSELGFFLAANISEQFFNFQMVRVKCVLSME